MEFINYYIYAVRGYWMDRYKVGYYIADLKDLIKRYMTYYGNDLDLIVFELKVSKQEAKKIEDKVHQYLRKYYCGSNELFYKECIDSFIEICNTLCERTVTIPLIRKINKNKKTSKIPDIPEQVNITNSNTLKKKDNIKNIIRERYTDVLDADIHNTDPSILPCINGDIILKTGELKNNKHVYKKINTKFNGLNSQTYLVDKLMNDLFNDDCTTIEYLQRMLGYGLIGGNPEQIVVIFHGEGSNGKGLLVNLLEKLLGTYFVYITPEVIYKTDKRVRSDSHISILRNKRYICKSDSNDVQVFDTDMFKTISGGNKMTVRDNYAKDFVTFTPTFLPILLCNKRPLFNVNDMALMRRIVIIPFKNCYTNNKNLAIPLDINNEKHKIKDINFDYLHIFFILY